MSAAPILRTAFKAHCRHDHTTIGTTARAMYGRAAGFVGEAI